MFRSILCATDFSRGGFHAVATAVRWAESFGASLELLHVLTPLVTHAPATSFLEEMQAQLRNDAEGKLEALVAPLVPRVRASWRVVDGFPRDAIVARARQVGADLVVVGATSEAPLPRVLLGSVADRVARTADVPVLVVPAVAQGNLPRVIVAPSDLSPASERSVRFAQDLAAQVGASVDVVHAYALPWLTDPEGEWARELPQRLREHLCDRHALRRDAAVHVRPGAPAEVIVSTVEATRANLVVIASSGRGVGRLLGGTTDRVLRTTHEAVLVLHGP